MTDIVSDATSATSDKACPLPYTSAINECSSEAVSQYRAHKERLKRIAARAVVPPPVIVAPPPPAPPVVIVPGVRVTDRIGREMFISDQAIRETNDNIRAIRPLSIATIQAKVAEAYGLSRAEMTCAKRTAPFCLARQVAFYLSRQLTPFSLPEIGRRFGARDHTTVLHGARRIGQMIRMDANFAAKIEALKAQLVGERAAT